jgi:hypothetical protein
MARESKGTPGVRSAEQQPVHVGPASVLAIASSFFIALLSAVTLDSTAPQLANMTGKFET